MVADLAQRAAVTFGLGVAAILVAAPAAAADYGAKGPHATATSDLAPSAGGSTGGKLVVPTDAGPYPLIIASHGWSASAANQVGWAEHFASWGFVVVAPSFPNPIAPDANVDAKIITELVALYSNPPAGSPASGKVDATRIGLEGHSAGGLATTLAARDLKPLATVLFDPVDKADAGKAAYATVCSPVLSIFADGSSCNNNAGWSSFKATGKGPQTAFNVVGSSHCDGENTDRGVLCGIACGGNASPARQAVYGRYATAYFLAKVAGDAAAEATLAETALLADATITGVQVIAGASCASPAPTDGGVGGVDASAPTSDASVPSGPDASTGGSGGSHADGGAGGSDGGSGSGADPGTGGGCALGDAPSRGGAAWIAIAAAMAAMRRRRRG